ncbi:MAG TPA: DNA double-strand break repair nuclease NurA [Egibacteraceae bacterium]|nr:DNA double-strand break repair nuclease NurA [Egibacteraceae bacterium]
MRYAVDPWAPDYGAALDPQALDAGGVEVAVDVEVDAADWRPLRPAGIAPAGRVLFVDGVRRVDARVWVTTDDPSAPPCAGIAASYAAGVVCCDGAARIDAAESRQAVFSPVAGAPPIVTRCGDYAPVLADGESAEDLVRALQQQMRALERTVAAGLGDADLVVVDGPLSRPAVDGAVGYVKTHQRSYLPADLAGVVADLAPGERTPLFLTLTREPRLTWYARLPGGGDHPWAGIVRGEAPGEVAVSEARRLADLATVTWPRFASAAHKDPRAPQNLHPIAELERGLRRRLGDPAFLYRSLRSAVAAPAVRP